MELKIGDKVSFIGNYDNHGKYADNEMSLKQVVERNNNILTISYIAGDYIGIEEGFFWCFNESELERIDNKFRKSDLKDDDIVFLRNGTKLVVGANATMLYSVKFIATLTDYSDELKYEAGDEEYDIIHIKRPYQYKEVYREMKKRGKHSK